MHFISYLAANVFSYEFFLRLIHQAAIIVPSKGFINKHRYFDRTENPNESDSYFHSYRIFQQKFQKTFQLPQQFCISTWITLTNHSRKNLTQINFNPSYHRTKFFGIRINVSPFQIVRYLSEICLQNQKEISLLE